MDRHDPDNIRLLGKERRFSKIHVIFLQLLHIADKLKQPMIAGCFKFHRLFQQHFQIGTSLLSARKCCHIFDIMKTTHHCLRKLRHSIRHCLLPELCQHLQCFLYLFSQHRIFCLLRIFCQKHIFPEAFVQASATRRLCPDHCQFIFRKSHEKRSCHTAERNILIWIVAHPQKIHEQTDLHRGKIPCFRGNVHRDPFLCQHCLQLLDRTCAATHQNHDIPVRQRMHLSGFDILDLLPAHKRTDLFCDHIGFAFAGCERIFFLTFIQ